MPPSQPFELSTFPEELLERILSCCIIAPLSLPPRPSWHRPSNCTSITTLPVRGRVALLLVSKRFFRICTPLFYHTIHVLSAGHLHRLLTNAIRPNPFLASYVRRLVLYGIWADAGELLRLIHNGLSMLDLTLDVTQLSPRTRGQIRDFDAEEFCEGLKEVASLTHIIIRKPGNVYLTQPKPRYVLSEIAKAMQCWPNLEYADLPFRLSDDSGTAMNPALPSSTPRVVQVHRAPVTALTLALSTRPRLHTFCTLLPSVWNQTILRVSSNPALERIILGDGSIGMREQTHARGVSWSGKDFYAAPVSATLPTGPLFEATPGISGTSLFLLQARKHARLSELIRAGTSIMRTRAQTVVTPPASPTLSPPGSPLPPPSIAPPQSPIAPHCHPRSQSVIPTGSMESSFSPTHAQPITGRFAPSHKSKPKAGLPTIT